MSELNDLLAADCYGINYLKDGLRIKRKWLHLAALWSPCFCLQKRGLFGWRTVSWVYVEAIRRYKADYIEEWLRWEYDEPSS